MRATTKKTQKTESPRKRVTFIVSTAVAQRVRNTVNALIRRGDLDNVRTFAEDALGAACARLERKYNAGKPLPRSTQEAPHGRPKSVEDDPG